MTIDSFTASVALSLIESNPSSSTIEALSGILKDKGDNEPVPDDVVAFIESNIGNPVKVMGTSYKGVIHSCNKAQGGFYPGIRYPVYVRITETDDAIFECAIGQVFEYELDQIKLL